MDAGMTQNTVEIDDLTAIAGEALGHAENLYADARRAVGDLVVKDGRVSGALVEQNQTTVHGLAWVATYIEGLRQMLGWGQRLSEEGRFGELEQLMIQAAFGEYLNQLAGGIAVSQLEIVRPGELGVSDVALQAFSANDAVHRRADRRQSLWRTRPFG